MAEEEVDIRGETFINFPGLNGLTLVPLGLECVLTGGGLVAKLCPTLANPWTVALQVPLSMGFSRQENWSGWPFHSPEIFPSQEFNPGLLHCRQILYRLSYEGSLKNVCIFNSNGAA